MIKMIQKSYLVLLLLLTIYSYSQIDLNLTLSAWPPYQFIQKQLIQLGYFHRFWSTLIFSFFLLGLFTFYFYFLSRVKNKKINEKQIWFLIKAILFILVVSYPAFSHDIFNYIFDAKIIAFYRQNPYRAKPIDFSTDPMLRFMHWVHRPSIYPPGWIGLSLLPYWLGAGRFVLQLFAFKLLMALAWLGTIWLIGEIAAATQPKNKLLAITFYAFNPLVLIESLVSAHNDVVMFFFVLLAFWLFFSGRHWFKKGLGLLTFAFSVAIKYISVILAPVVIWFALFKKVAWQTIFKIALVLLGLGWLYIVWKIGHQPWYLLWFLPLAALLVDYVWVYWLTISFSFSSLLRYLPFLLTGNWGRLFKFTSPWLTILPPLATLFILVHLRGVLGRTPWVLKKLKWLKKK